MNNTTVPLQPVIPSSQPAPPSSAAEEFRMKFFPDADELDWNDWHWQISHRITSVKRLRSILPLQPEEEEAFSRGGTFFPLSVTPYFMSLVAEQKTDPSLRRTVIPTCYEYNMEQEDRIDPLGENENTAAPGLVHRYPDRVLFLTTEFCSVYCRYCTRSRIVGKNRHTGSSYQRWDQAIAYIAAHTEIRDVLLSGGDPLTLEDHELEYLLKSLSLIPHVEIVRIGTKVPVVLPMRVTSELTEMLKRYHPLWMSIHFTHPFELTSETAEACGRLADAGIPLGSQTVLLKGINDSGETLKTLFKGLLKMRVRPYYLYQCDPVVGTSHFRTSIEQGLDIIEEIRGFTSGYAVPSYVVDAPGGGGKIPLLYDHIIGREGGDLLLQNYEKRTFRYPDPDGTISSSRKNSI